MGSRDFISSLPDEILGKILCILPTKLVVITSVLSKRWRNLFPLVNNLDFDPKYQAPARIALDFYAFLKHNICTKRPPIKKLSWSFQHGDKSNHWIRIAMESGCLELHLQSQRPYSLDFRAFYINSLVKLTISDGFDLSDRGTLIDPLSGVTFPTLKSLSLGAVWMRRIEYASLCDHCPLLEELFILNINDEYPSTWEGFVTSESIKRLSISVVTLPSDEEPLSLCTVWFYAPALVYLDYSCYVSRHYEVVDLHSLVEARLDIRFCESTTIDHDDYGSILYDFDGDVTDLVAGISSTKTLHLSPSSLEVLHWGCKSMPVFNNLLSLSIHSDKERGWQIVPLLLKSSPNLQTLVIKGLVHKVTNECGDACPCIPNMLIKKRKMGTEEEMSCLWTCQVKVLEISGYEGTCQELKQMKHFLGKLKYLETVKIALQRGNNNYLSVTNDLKKLRRVSSRCQMHFF